MKDTKKHIKIVVLCVFLFTIDQILKLLSYRYPEVTIYLINPYIGWEHFLNPGIAFGIPIPRILVLITTPIILIALYFILIRKNHHNNLRYYAYLLVFIGSLSNLTDRIRIGFTIDYIRLSTSILNLADAMIFFGIILFIYGEYNIKSKNDNPMKLDNPNLV
jgi:lipoprotein signal peptidase